MKEDTTMQTEEPGTWLSVFWVYLKGDKMRRQNNIEAEAKAHIDALLAGIIAWANDEDGVHDQCFDAFRSAAYFIGKPELVKDETDG